MIKPELIENALQSPVDSKMLLDIFSWPLLGAIIISCFSSTVSTNFYFFNHLPFEWMSLKVSLENASLKWSYAFLKNMSFGAGVVSGDSL